MVNLKTAVTPCGADRCHTAVSASLRLVAQAKLYYRPCWIADVGKSPRSLAHVKPSHTAPLTALYAAALIKEFPDSPGERAF